MVYCGKLSKACLPCRERKLICDLRKDGCSQCNRAQLTCYGYRDTEALRFRDETQAVQRRVQAREATKSIPRSLKVSICSQAKDVFYYNYVVGIGKPFGFLQAFHATTSNDEHLNRSVNAVALAYLNYQRYSQSAQEEAIQQYIAALSLTSTAITSPDLAKKDSTILAILLLDLYEKITTKEPTFEGAWATHLTGALTLVNFRGDQQFKDPSALGMLKRLSINMLISCVAGNRPVSTELIALRSKIIAHFPSSVDPKWLESDLTIELIKLQQDIKDGVLSHDLALSSLMDLDAKFLRLSLEVEPAWQYKTVQVDEKSAHHYQLYHHVYPAEHIAQLWNVLRLTRIELNELICSHCLDCQGCVKQDSKILALYQYATRTIIAMASSICASVPQYIEQDSGSSKMSMTSTNSSRIISDNNNHILSIGQPNPTRHLPCYRLIFPLYVAAQSTAAPRSLKLWVIDQLLYMAEFHAIENAAIVARILESGEKKNLWILYAMLGSYAFVC